MIEKYIRIGLLGFEFKSPNKGCEALTYSFINILLELFGGYKIKIYNFSNYTLLGDVPNYFTNVEFEEVSIRRRDLLKLKVKEKLKKCDVVFDVTMGDSFSDIYSKKSCNYLLDQKKLAEKYSNKYVLLPQTYGPFYDKIVQKRALNIISRANLVLCRDEMSKNFLNKSLPTKSIDVLTDLAFFLPTQKKCILDENDKIKIGINVSGLLWRGGFSGSNQFGLKCNYQEYINTLLQEYTNNDIYKLYFIPHVIKEYNTTADDDYDTIQYLAEKYPNAVLAPKFTNPMEAKGYISQMDLFIGARMHSTIAAFSTGVPVVPFSYSRKFEGLYNDYDYEYLINGKELSTSDAINATKTYINNYLEIRNSVNNKQVLISEKKQQLLKFIESIF